MSLGGGGGSGGGSFNLAMSGGGFLGGGPPTMVGVGVGGSGVGVSSATVIHSPSASSNPNEEELLSDEEARKRRELLARRPSYRKIFNDLSDVEGALKTEPGEGGEGSEPAPPVPNGGGGGPPLSYALGVGGMNGAPDGSGGVVGGALMAPSASLLAYAAAEAPAPLLPVSQGPDVLGLRPVGTASPGGYSPVHSSASSIKSLTGGDVGGGGGPEVGGLGGPPVPGTSNQKRQLRLLKNREAAKECRRKKKEYVKCLENRVAVLENQNKALIEELKTLKELYCRKGE